MKKFQFISAVFMAFLVLGYGLFLDVASCQAGAFTESHFVQPGSFALGLETELTLSHGAGFGFNVKYTQGVNDLINFTGILGTGGGPRAFRVGANTIFDFFPDTATQPGIGLGVQGMYYRLSDDRAVTEVTAIPYLHKVFASGGNEIEPFMALSSGVGFLSDGTYKGVSTLIVGSMFKGTQHLRYSAEFGVAVNNSESYFSTGVAYFY